MQRCFAAAEPALALSVGRRSRLREALDEAEAAGRLRLGRSHPDRFAEPALPRFVTVLSAGPVGRREATVPPGRSGAGLWRPELVWASGLRLSPAEAGFLRQVGAFLRDLPADEPVVPIRERSLELTGDEKRLEGLLGGRLFAPGRLSLGLLRCRQVHPPFLWCELGAAPVALVVENHQTYDSLGVALRAATQLAAGEPGPPGRAGLLVYGAGNHFAASVAHLAELPRPPDRVVYFGDLDPEGIEIPRRAQRVAAAAGLPPVEPAGRLYELLLQHGRPARSRAIPAAAADRAAGWLPDALRPRVAELLAAGLRYPQEGLGLRVLLRLDPLVLLAAAGERAGDG